MFDNDFRHPARLAKEAASVDVLSGGRLEFGIGAGWLKPEYDQTGIPFEPPAVRVSRLEEAVQVIKGLWGDDPLTFSGRHYTITGLAGTAAGNLLHHGLPRDMEAFAPVVARLAGS